MASAFIPAAAPLSTRRATFITICARPTSRPHLLSAPVRRPRAPAMTLEGSDRGSNIVEGPFDGQYGQWSLTQADADGVMIYRVALAVMALAMSSVATLALTAGSDVPSLAYDALYFTSTAAFGVALANIHIYMKPMHNLLKASWGVGAAASVALCLSPLLTNGLVQDTYAHPALLLAIGWQFVALTGLFVKEAFCFGRFEALSLIALVPVLAGGHFLGVLPDTVERGGAAAFAALFLLFAARKFMQPARDDIGDMSVFHHLAKGGEL